MATLPLQAAPPHTPPRPPPPPLHPAATPQHAQSGPCTGPPAPLALAAIQTRRPFERAAPRIVATKQGPVIVRGSTRKRGAHRQPTQAAGTVAHGITAGPLLQEAAGTAASDNISGMNGDSNGADGVTTVSYGTELKAQATSTPLVAAPPAAPPAEASATPAAPSTSERMPADVAVAAVAATCASVEDTAAAGHGQHACSTSPQPHLPHPALHDATGKHCKVSPAHAQHAGHIPGQPQRLQVALHLPAVHCTPVATPADPGYPPLTTTSVALPPHDAEECSPGRREAVRYRIVATPQGPVRVRKRWGMAAAVAAGAGRVRVSEDGGTASQSPTRQQLEPPQLRMLASQRLR